MNRIAPAFVAAFIALAGPVHARQVDFSKVEIKATDLEQASANFVRVIYHSLKP